MKRELRAIFYIPLIYFILGSLWILLSDKITLSEFGNAVEISRWQTIKGLAYVSFSSLLLVGLIYGYARNLEASRSRLQDSRNKLRSIVESLPAGIAETDSNGRVDFVSDRFVEIAGLERKRILNQHIQDFFPEVSQIIDSEAHDDRVPEVLSLWQATAMSPDQKVFRIRCFQRNESDSMSGGR